MNYLSPRKLRNGKLLTPENPNQIDILPRESRTRNMENVNNDVNVTDYDSLSFDS